MYKFVHVIWKDLKAEFRTKQMLNSMLVFAFLVVTIFSFSFQALMSYFFDIQGIIASASGDRNAYATLLTNFAPGVLWIAFTFTGILGISRSFAAEKEEGCLEGLKLCPVERYSIYTGKAVANAVLMFVMEILAVPVFIVLFNYSGFTAGSLLVFALVAVLGTLGFVFVGTLLSALTVNIRTRELLLPVVLFPVLAPLLIASVQATGKALAGSPPGEIAGELQLLLVYDVIFFIAAQLVFEYAIED